MRHVDCLIFPHSHLIMRILYLMGLYCSPLPLSPVSTLRCRSVTQFPHPPPHVPCRFLVFQHGCAPATQTTSKRAPRRPRGHCFHRACWCNCEHLAVANASYCRNDCAWMRHCSNRRIDCSSSLARSLQTTALPRPLPLHVIQATLCLINALVKLCERADPSRHVQRRPVKERGKI